MAHLLPSVPRRTPPSEGRNSSFWRSIKGSNKPEEAERLSHQLSETAPSSRWAGWPGSPLAAGNGPRRPRPRNPDHRPSTPAHPLPRKPTRPPKTSSVFGPQPGRPRTLQPRPPHPVLGLRHQGPSRQVSTTTHPPPVITRWPGPRRGLSPKDRVPSNQLQHKAAAVGNRLDPPWAAQTMTFGRKGLVGCTISRRYSGRAAVAVTIIRGGGRRTVRAA